MNQNLRYATVRKYAKRELVSGNFQHAVFGARLYSNSKKLETKLANTPEEIVYFLDDNSYNKFVKVICRRFPVVADICAVHKN